MIDRTFPGTGFDNDELTITDISRERKSPYKSNIHLQDASRGSLQPFVGYSRIPAKSMIFLHVPAQGVSYGFLENLTVSRKPFKNLMKMHLFAVAACASPWLADGGAWISSWIPAVPLPKTIIKLCCRCAPSGIPPATTTTRIPTLRIPWKSYGFSKTM